LDTNILSLNELLIKRALRHVHIRTKIGKQSSLEGYIYFYNTLNSLKFCNGNRSSVKEENRLKNRSKDVYYNNLEAITTSSILKDNLEIDTCDICI
jgi:hypothetical protein